jgi:hypothetical protein
LSHQLRVPLSEGLAEHSQSGQSRSLVHDYYYYINPKISWTEYYLILNE